jgi:hypothetical protein
MLKGKFWIFNLLSDLSFAEGLTSLGGHLDVASLLCLYHSYPKIFATRRTNALLGKPPLPTLSEPCTDPPNLKTDTWWTCEESLFPSQNEVIKWPFYKINY